MDQIQKCGKISLSSMKKNIIRSLASFQLSINNLLELITKIKEIPSTFSHSEMLKNELEEIKKYKEDTF